MKITAKDGGWSFEGAPDFKLSADQRTDLAAVLPPSQQDPDEALEVIERAILRFLARGALTVEAPPGRVRKKLELIEGLASALADELHSLGRGTTPVDRAAQAVLDRPASGTDDPAIQIPHDTGAFFHGMKADLSRLSGIFDAAQRSLEHEEPSAGRGSAKHELTYRLAHIWNWLMGSQPPRSKENGPWPRFLHAIAGIELNTSESTLGDYWSAESELRWYSDQTGDISGSK